MPDPEQPIDQPVRFCRRAGCFRTVDYGFCEKCEQGQSEAADSEEHRLRDERDE